MFIGKIILFTNKNLRQNNKRQIVLKLFLICTTFKFKIIEESDHKTKLQPQFKFVYEFINSTIYLFLICVMLFYYFKTKFLST